MMIELANMQKKQHKASKKRSSKKSGGTKIAVLPQHASAPVTTSQIRAYTDSSLDALRKSLGINQNYLTYYYNGSSSSN